MGVEFIECSHQWNCQRSITEWVDTQRGDNRRTINERKPPFDGDVTASNRLCRDEEPRPYG